jgi:hypothetical protein
LNWSFNKSIANGGNRVISHPEQSAKRLNTKKPTVLVGFFVG